jgi:hypothetical protein
MNLLNMGSLQQPLMRTPLGVGSMRKCRTSSFRGSAPGFICTFGGALSTLSARPYAPGKLLLSRMRNVPGCLSFSKFIAIKFKKIKVLIYFFAFIYFCIFMYKFFFLLELFSIRFKISKKEKNVMNKCVLAFFS